MRAVATCVGLFRARQGKHGHNEGLLITLQTDLASKDHPGLVEMLRREPHRDIALERARGETAHPLCALLSIFESFGPGETRGEEEIARVTHAAPHLSLAEVKNRMRTDPRADWRHGFLIIYNALVEPRSAEEIAQRCGVSKATVHAVISRYPLSRRRGD